MIPNEFGTDTRVTKAIVPVSVNTGEECWLVKHPPDVLSLLIAPSSSSLQLREYSSLTRGGGSPDLGHPFPRSEGTSTLWT